MKVLLLSVVFAFAFCQVEAGFKCKPGSWSQWYDRDNPSGVGDWEHLNAYNSLPVAQRPCGGGYIRCIHYRIKSTNDCRIVGSPNVQCRSEAASVFLYNNPTQGFVCRNQDQPHVLVGGTWQRSCCCDYEVRYRCG